MWLSNTTRPVAHFVTYFTLCGQSEARVQMPRLIAVVAGFIAALAVSNAALGCRCRSEAPGFMSQAPNADLLVIGRVIAFGTQEGKHHASPYMEIAVQRTLGRRLAARTVRVLGDPGYLCRTGLGELAAGRVYALILTRTVDDTAYELLGQCVQHYAELRNGNLYGRLTDEDWRENRGSSAPLARLEAVVRK